MIQNWREYWFEIEPNKRKSLMFSLQSLQLLVSLELNNKFWKGHDRKIKKKTIQKLGGHSHVRGIGLQVCAALMTPFSGFSATPETHLFTPSVPASVSSYALRFLGFFFPKNSAFLGPFLSDFGKISAPNNTNFDENLFPRPYFCVKNPFCRPYFWKLVWHKPTKKKKKKKIECPQGKNTLFRTF